MLVSTKGRYALRTMIDLALHGSGEPVKIKDIARRVRSVRGNQGGYYLTRPASEYTVGMILRITEGNLAPVDCLAGEDNPCQRRDDCVTLRLWQELDDAIRGVVDQYTIEDLARWQEAAK